MALLMVSCETLTGQLTVSNDLKFKEACNIVFGEVIRVAENRKSKAREITDFFKLS